MGDLFSATPLRRQAVRRRVRSIGQTNPNFAAPAAGSLADSAGGALQDAAFALQNQFDSVGATPIHTFDPVVLAFQKAWNADAVASRSGPLDTDGNYGPNTHDALDAVTGLANDVVPGGGPAPSPPAPAPPKPAPTPSHPAVAPAAGGGMSAGTMLILGGAAAAVALWFLFFRGKKKRVIHHHHPESRALVQVNPRRRGRRWGR